MTIADAGLGLGLDRNTVYEHIARREPESVPVGLSARVPVEAMHGVAGRLSDIKLDVARFGPPRSGVAGFASRRLTRKHVEPTFPRETPPTAHRRPLWEGPSGTVDLKATLGGRVP